MPFRQATSNPIRIPAAMAVSRITYRKPPTSEGAPAPRTSMTSMSSMKKNFRWVVLILDANVKSEFFMGYLPIVSIVECQYFTRPWTTKVASKRPNQLFIQPFSFVSWLEAKFCFQGLATLLVLPGQAGLVLQRSKGAHAQTVGLLEQGVGL